MNDDGRSHKTDTDGVDMRYANAQEIKKYWSHKFKKSALRYQVTTAVATGYIVYISCGHPAGRYPDISVFRDSGLKELLLEEGEKTVADKGYRGEPECIMLPDDGDDVDYQEEMAEIRARHETVNRRIKMWKSMDKPFRHKLVFHQKCFDAVVVLTQMMMESGEPAWQLV